MDAATWDQRYAASDLVWSLEPNRFVVEQLSDLPPGRAIDVAAGEGRNSLWLAERGWQVDAVEFSEVGLDKLRSLADARGVEVTTVLADVTDGIPVDPADLVLLAYLHLPRQSANRALRASAALVRPGGTLLVVAHARANLERGYGGPPDPDVLPTIDDLLDDLAETGLAIDRAGEVTRTVDTDEGPRDAIDLLLRARRPV